MNATRRPSPRKRVPPRATPRRAAAGPGAAGAVPEACKPADRPIPPCERATLARGLDRLRAAARRTREQPLQPGDELFPELEGMGDMHVTEAIAQALEREGVDPALVFAFRKTGLLVSAETLPFLSAGGRRAWTAALREFADLQD